MRLKASHSTKQAPGIIRPQKFSLEKRLRDSFGVHSGQGEFAVVIRFDEFAADYIREKRWHPSQQIKELAGGGLELRLKLSSLGEIERWVLGWGHHARVLNPPELIASVRRAAELTLKNYPRAMTNDKGMTNDEARMTKE